MTTLTIQRVAPEAVWMFLGDYGINFVMEVYSLMMRHCPDFQGGAWDCFAVSNGGFFLSLADTERVRLIDTAIHYDQTLSSHAAGIAVTLRATNKITNAGRHTHVGSPQLLRLLSGLLEYASEQSEAAVIEWFACEQAAPCRN